jgi:lysozyme
MRLNEKEKLKLVDILRFEEGTENLPYLCSADKVTIGVGHNLEAFGYRGIPAKDFVGVSLGKAHEILRRRVDAKIYDPSTGLTNSAINDLLLDDLQVIITQVEANFDNILPRHYMPCLVELAFQLGINGLLGFKRAIKALEQNNIPMAIVHFLDSKWNLQTRGRSLRVMTRLANSI